MPVFTKRLLCSRSNSRADGRRSGCRGSSSSDDDDAANGQQDSGINTDYGQPRCRSNSEAEFGRRQPNRRDDDDQDGFRFLLTVANMEANTGTVLEFEHANMAQDTSSITEEPEPKRPPKKAPKKTTAKSSCGRASSNEDESSMEDEPSLEQPKAKEDADADFLVLLTGLLAHGPPPADDFRFLLTVHQPEAAT